jgi:AGZA family xanthine/uracil permease-like MFS transporter
VAEAAKIPLAFAENFGVFVLLAHGFILTGMLWGAAMAFMIDGRTVRAAVVLAICGALSVFGVIHSVLPTGGIYLPGSPALQGSHVPWHWAAAYFAFAAMVLIFGRLAAGAEPARSERDAA